MRSILVASDLTERSDRALRRALVLANTWNLPLSVIHVVDEDLPADLIDSESQQARLHIDNLITEHGGGVTAHVDVRTGRDYKDILDAAEAIDAEVIILGCHRETGTGDHLTGTVVERVIRRGHRPVIVAASDNFSPYRKILVCVDFSVQSHSAMRYAADLVPDGQFHFVHAYQIPFHGFMRGHETHDQVREAHEAHIRQLVKRQMDEFGTTSAPFHAQMERIVEEGPPMAVIPRQIARIKPDLVVAGTHGRTGVSHLLLGSVAEELVRCPPCDVLVVKGW